MSWVTGERSKNSITNKNAIAVASKRSLKESFNEFPDDKQELPGYLKGISGVDIIPFKIQGLDIKLEQDSEIRNLRLLKREQELAKREAAVRQREYQLEQREKELDERELKIKNHESTLRDLRRQRWNSLKVSYKRIDFDLELYDKIKITKCQRIIKSFLHKKRLKYGKSMPKNIFEVVKLIQQTNVNEYPDKKAISNYWSALREFLYSEERYASDLIVLIHSYKLPMLTNGELITPEEVDIIFGNISEIYDITSKFRRSLKKGFDQIIVSDVNLHHTVSSLLQDLPNYAKYYINFDDSIVLREKLMRSRKFCDYLDQLKESSPCPSYDLDSFLIQPCQRVPRYKILLDAIVKNTPSTNRLRPVFILLSEQLEQILLQINDIKRKSDEKKKIEQFVSNLIIPPDFISAGLDKNKCTDLIYSAPLNILPKVLPRLLSLKGKFGLLFSEYLLITKSKGNLNEVLCFVAVNEISQVEIISGKCYRYCAS